jgi:hypothetical protein
VRTPARVAEAPAIPVLTGGKGLRPGVTLDRHADLLDLMDDEVTGR